MSPEGKQQDLISDYVKKVLKMIPSEIVLVYATLITFIPNLFLPQLIVSLVLLIITPLYLVFTLGVVRKAQIYLSVIAFAVWVFYLGGPFIFSSWYEKWMAGTVLIIFSLVPPMIIKSSDDENRLEAPVRKKFRVNPDFGDMDSDIFIDKSTGRREKSWREI